MSNPPPSIFNKYCAFLSSGIRNDCSSKLFYLHDLDLKVYQVIDKEGKVKLNFLKEKIIQWER